MAKVPRPRWNELIPEIDSGSNDQTVDEANIIAPFTTIQNRAKIEANCKVVGPVERIRINSLVKLVNEFGPNGEPVWTSDKEDLRVRFVGNFQTIFGAWGMYPQLTKVGDNSSFVEVTFYGTGLNGLGVGYINRDYDIYVDGIFNNSVSLSSLGNDSILGGRAYNVNSLVSLVKNLTLGWHTVRIENTTASSQIYSQSWSGFEILNESADLSVLSGSIFKKSRKYTLESNSTIPMIPASYTGTQGCRVLVYLDENNEIQQAVNEVNETPSYLFSSDHSNEVVYRRINFREFGRNRGDDFVTLAGSSDRFFTLDDGTTTLVANDMTQNTAFTGIDSMAWVSSGSYVTITFIGTGLDIEFQTSGSTGTFIGQLAVSIDGAAEQSLVPNIDTSVTTKIASDLPYGTHTVKVRLNTASQVTLSDFYIYKPKKPSVSKQLPILADYNIMADFISNTDTDPNKISQGTLRKSNMREFIYKGTWGIVTNVNDINGIEVYSNTAGSYMEYTFVGTGFDLRMSNSNILSTWTLSVDGNTNLSSYTTDFHGFASFDDTTGLLTTNTAVTLGTGVIVSDLPYGVHTIRVTQTSGTGNNDVQSLDIITPIHNPDVMIGNQTIKDTREINRNKSDKDGISYARANQNSGITYVSKNIAQVQSISTGRMRIYFEDVYVDEDSFSGVSNSSNVDTSTGTDGWRKNYIEFWQFLSDTNVYQNQNPGHYSVVGKLEKYQLEDSDI